MARTKLIDTSKPQVALKRFTLDGKEYQQGEVVDLSGQNSRLIERMYRHRFIGAGTPVSQPRIATAPQPVAPVATPEPVAQPKKTESGVIGKLFHAGGGQWEVQDANGVNMLPDRIKGKDMAKMAAEQFGITIVE